MPELPEVEIAMRGISPFLEGRAIERCALNAPALRYPFGEKFTSALENAVVRKLERRGKFILLHLDNARTLIWHLGMSGRIRTYARQGDYTAEKHDHVVFSIEGGALVVYNDSRRFGFMRIVPTAGWQDEAHFSGMGPEPLGNGFSAPVLLEVLRGKSVPIKVALLDQKIVAGIGNIYASEALFGSGINPARSASSLSLEEAELLASAIRHVLEKAIAAGGSSLKDYQHTDGTLGYFQHMFSVYDRAGEPCAVCGLGAAAHNGGGGIVKITQGGRSTFYCPHCQK